MLHPLRDRRRRELERQPFPREWAEAVDRNVPYGRGLDPDERRRLENLIKVFVAEKNFEGCGGLAMTDEIRVTIAAQACLLLLNLRHDYYERLSSILVYPESFEFEQTEPGPGGMASVTARPVLGLSSTMGAVVLSWPDSLRGGQGHADGTNVVLHEFAHQLDRLDDAMDGAPPLDTAAMYRDWARVLGREFKRLQEEVESGAPAMISDYGATRPAEFFAVVTELFFERPLDLRREHPDLYNEFRQYYHQDPAGRIRGALPAFRNETERDHADDG